MKKSILTIVMAALCFFFNAKAQQQHTTLTGKITDQKGNPIPGSTIKIKNEKITALTNIKGDFKLISSRTSGILIVSFLGFQTREIPFSSSGIIPTIELEEEKSNLNEVVVIGYGQTTKRMSTGSIASISAKEIESQPVTNVLSALSGRMPGVFVQTTNGLPGGNINVQIRGKGSLLAGTNPLYIVDGVPYEGNSPSGVTNTASTNNIVGNLSPLNNLNPSDIESITVLKDADATSIYGSRGTNGVVIITTKQNKKTGTHLEAALEQSISRVANLPRLLNLKDYLTMRREAFANENRIPSSDPTSANYAPDLTLWSQDEGTDWADYLIGGKARATYVQSKLSGGNERSNFSVSGNYRNETTVLPGENAYQRAGLLSQVNHTSKDNKFNLSLSNSISFQQSDFVNPVSNLNSSYLIAPNYPVYLPDGSVNWSSNTNLMAEINSRSKTNADNLITNLNLNYKPLPELTFKLNAGYTKISYLQKQIFPKRALSPSIVNYTNFVENGSRSIIIEPQVDYQYQRNSSKINFTSGLTYQKRNLFSHFLKASNFSAEELMEDLASGATIDSRSNANSIYKYLSVFGRVNFNFMDIFLVNATFRRDGSSRFGTGNRFGNFGSLGGAVLFSNFNFFKEHVPIISLGKIRVSYGSTGNDQIADYQYLSTYSSPGTNTYQGTATTRPSRISNMNYRWEMTRKLDLAMELGLLRDRIYLTANYYRNKSKDQLVEYTLPRMTGFGSYQANLPAVIENKGWEFSLAANLVNSRLFSWSTNFNLTIPKNKLISFENFETSSYVLQYELGADITRLSGPIVLDIDDAKGTIVYADQDGKASGTPYLYHTLGKLTPDFYGGFGNTLRYRNVELNVFTQFVKQVGKGGGESYPGRSVYNNFNFVNSRWSSEHPQADFPKASVVSDFYYPFSSLRIFDTSYFRIKNITLAFHTPEKVLKRIKMQQLKIYLEGQNMFTIWNKNSGVVDPESGVLRSTSGPANLPPLKTVALGVQMTF